MDRRELLTKVGIAVASASAPVNFAAALPAEASPKNSAKRAVVEGCTALVTGANQGIGRGFVEVLLARGAKRVYATARRPDTLAEIVAIDPRRVVPLELDVNNDGLRRAAAAKALDVTWLINNAGINGSTVSQERRVLSASNLEDAHLVMDTNCWSPAELARLFIPIILKNGGGVVVNILSIGALFAVPEYVSYSMSKAAAARATAGLRAELDRQPILVAGVYTGGVTTRMSPPGYTGSTPDEHAHEVIDALAAGETDIFAGKGATALRDQLLADPKAFERAQIDRFYAHPIESRGG